MARKTKDTGWYNDRQFASTPRTDEERLKELAVLAMDLAEERLRNGTASSAETTLFLSLLTPQTRSKNELATAQTALAKSKKTAIDSSQTIQKLIEDGMAAFGRYQGALNDIDDEFL